MTTIHLQTAESCRTITVSSKSPQTLCSILSQEGYPINARCGERGLCNACQVLLLKGSTANICSGTVTHAPTMIKSCQQAPMVNTEIVLRIPERTLLRHKPSIVSDFKVGIARSFAPLAPPAENEKIPWIGAAVDIGTTTVALLLCDLRTGKVLATESTYNAQVRYGEDLITRIQLCSQNKQNIAQLQSAVVKESIQPLLENACQKASLALCSVYSMVIAANTTMLHLLAGVDPTSIGIHPFNPVFLDHRVYTPQELGLSFGPPEAQVHLLPGPSAYVGADISAGILASGMLYEEGPLLFVDVGTNGEIVLKNKNRLLGSATAAGPAFEGTGLTHGTRATDGAIEKISVHGNPPAITYRTIGKALPHGICGSAYIDFLAEARHEKLLTEYGRITVPRKSSLIIEQPPKSTQTLEITGKDISRLLQAKAAIAAGISTLLDIEEIQPKEIKTLYLAGGFGLHLDVTNAIAIGLLPGFNPTQINSIGNSSLAGALAVLEDRRLLAELRQICSQIKSIELNLQPGFEDNYIDQLALP